VERVLSPAVRMEAVRDECQSEWYESSGNRCNFSLRCQPRLGVSVRPAASTSKFGAQAFGEVTCEPLFFEALENRLEETSAKRIILRSPGVEDNDLNAVGFLSELWSDLSSTDT
jgi:hypothetical protein